MDIYHLSEVHKGDHKIVELDGSRYLIAHNFSYKVEHTVIIENPGVDSRIAQEFRSNHEADDPGLEKFDFFVVDAGTCLFLFWCSETYVARLFGDQYQVDDYGTEILKC